MSRTFQAITLWLLHLFSCQSVLRIVCLHCFCYAASFSAAIRLPLNCYLFVRLNKPNSITWFSDITPKAPSYLVTLYRFSPSFLIWEVWNRMQYFMLVKLQCEVPLIPLLLAFPLWQKQTLGSHSHPTLGSLCDLQLYLSEAAQPVCSQDAQMQSQCRILHFVRFLLAHFSSSSGLSELNLCYLKSWLLFLFQYHPLIFWGFTPSHCSSCQWRYWIILAPLWTPLPASNWMLSHPGLAFNSAVHQLYSPSHFSNLYLLSLPMRTLGKWILVVFSKNWTVIWSISGRFIRQIFETSLMKGSFT